MILYFSGVEGRYYFIINMLERGYRIKGILVSYPHVRKRNIEDELAKIKKYNVNVIMDSGSHGILFAAGKVKNREQSHQVNKKLREIVESGDYDAYFNEYLEWLKNHKDLYDYAVELDLPGLVPDEKINEWRNKMIEAGIPTILTYNMEKDTLDFFDIWSKKGVKYFGFDGLKAKGEEEKYANLFKELKNRGFKIHLFGYTSEDLFLFKDLVDSVDSTAWMSAGRFARVYIVKDEKLRQMDVKADSIATQMILNDDFFINMGIADKVRKAVAERKGLALLDYYNMKVMQQYVDDMNMKGFVEKKKYEIVLEDLKKQGLDIPEWAKEKDAKGRDKIRYLASRFNSYKTGAYARVLHSFALTCDVCPVRTKCPFAAVIVDENGNPKYDENGLPVFKDDACYFIPYWKKLGKMTRNKDAILSKLEDIIQSKIERMERVKYFNDRTGGSSNEALDRMENDVARLLELYHRLVFGEGSKQNINVVTVGGDIKVTQDSLEETLKAVREEYGKEFEERLRKKIERGGADGSTIQ